MSEYLYFVVLLCVLLQCHGWTLVVNSTPPLITKDQQQGSHLSLNVSNFLRSGHQLWTQNGSTPTPLVLLQSKKASVTGVRNVTANITVTLPGSTPAYNSCISCIKENFMKEMINVSETDLEKIRLQEVKRHILKKLRMSDRPQVTMQRSMLPEPLQGGELQYLFNQFAEQPSNDEDDYYGKTERVIVIAEHVDFPICTNHHDPAGCFHFKLTKDIMKRDISSAELWVYKLRDKRDNYNQTYIVSEYPTSNGTYTNYIQHNIVSIRDTSLKNGWLKFDLTNTVRRWLWWKSRSSMLGLRISCKTCGMDIEEIPVSNDPGEKPFIVINFNTAEQHKRTKKNGVCEPNSPQCCKQPFYVNFTDIGWDDWIIAPEGYWANFCNGSCIDDRTSKYNHYVNIIQMLRNKSLLSSSWLRDLTPCCSPKKLIAMSLLYTTSAGNIIVNTLPNMIVESCGCK